MAKTLKLSDDAARAGHERLAAIKAELVHLADLQDKLWQRVATLVREIQENALYRLDGYTSMDAYYPALLKELQQVGALTVNSKRSLQDYVRLDKLFREELGIASETLALVKPSHLIQIAERTDYNPRTGAVAEAPRTGKIGRERALEMVEMLAHEAPEGWRVQDTQEVLEQETGVVRRTVEVRSWQPMPGVVQVKRVVIYEDGAMYDIHQGLPPHLYEWLVKKLNAVSTVS